jgi:hypothetical protein
MLADTDAGNVVTGAQAGAQWGYRLLPLLPLLLLIPLLYMVQELTVRLASSAFLVYDRIFRYRPAAFLFPANFKTNLRLKNVSAETIIIDEIVIKPPMLTIARANDLVTVNEERAAVWYPNMEDKRPEGIYVVIKPEEERTFALHRFADFENAEGHKNITIRCRWRNTRKSFPMPRYVRIKTTVKEIRDLREASLAGKV